MKASCDPQSGQAPMKSCAVPARSPAVPSGPGMPAWTGAGADATAPPRRSCWMPCFSCIHFSIAIPIAIEKWMQEKQGIQQDLLGGAVASAPAPVQAGIPGPEGTAGERAGTAQDFIGACPDCGSQLAFIEGCAKCHVCGFSECG